ncbi:MAG TPA: Gfo/Idh/MocA family oxidoreductase [Bryobacteraceae bacterium]|nr:Gfo/Idh/MocA family oxidoreductase [Bryobacteraceae bacterium]
MRKIRYAVVGLGHISQNALLPSFKNAKNSELAALVTGDETKREELAELYNLPADSVISYGQYDEFLESGKVDAVYIGLPNHLHAEYTIRTARAGVHVLCEKPMAVDEHECEQMIEACQKASVKLMIAYRLHFEPANLEAVQLASSGKLGDLRIFNSSFTQQVKAENVRLREPESRGGGSVYDMGIYCINAARYLFRDEPIEVLATSSSKDEPRFSGSPEMTNAVMRFSGERLASFVSSFGAASVSEYTLLGTEGWIRLSPAYDYQIPLALEVAIGDDEPKRKKFRKHDQFGPELTYFSACILNDKEPEPSGVEGLADVRIIRAIIESARTRRPVRVQRVEKRERPSKVQEITRPAVKPDELVHASPPSED